MVRIAEGLLEVETGLFQVTGPRQALDLQNEHIEKVSSSPNRPSWKASPVL